MRLEINRITESGQSRTEGANLQSLEKEFMQNSLFDELTIYLRQWNGRRRLRDGLLWVPRGVLAGLLLAVVVATVARLRPLLTSQEVLWAAAGLTIAGTAAALIFLFLQRRNLWQQARFADVQFALNERTTTAVEIHEGAILTTSVLAQQQLSDTVTAVQQVDAKNQLPLKLNRQDWLVILLAIVLLAVAVLLPNAQEAILQEQRELKQTIEEQVAELEALAQEIQENPALTEEQQEELLEPLESAIEALNEGDLSQEEAVAVLSEAEADLRELAASSNNEALRQQLETAGEPLANNETTQALGEAMQNGNLAQMGQELAQLADTLPSLSADELAQLAEDLAETAAALQGTDAELAQELAQAAEALRNGDIAAAQQALREGAATSQQRAQETAASQQANAAADTLNQSRESVAQSGQSGTQQAEGNQTGEGQDGQQGQNGQGQGNQQGQGQPLGQGQGQGEGQGQGQGADQNGGQVGGIGQGGGHTDNVFVPPLREFDEEGVEIELPAECAANPADCGGLLSETPTDFDEESSIVPYQQVFGDYRDAANQALEDDYIPLGLKGYVREYFTSLEP